MPKSKKWYVISDRLHSFCRLHESMKLHEAKRNIQLWDYDIHMVITCWKCNLKFETNKKTYSKIRTFKRITWKNTAMCVVCRVMNWLLAYNTFKERYNMKLSEYKKWLENRQIIFNQKIKNRYDAEWVKVYNINDQPNHEHTNT